jgi:hypothetical protein
MSATIDKIRRFGMSANITELAMGAEKLLREHGYPETDAFPGDGEIQVTGYLDRVCVTIEISEEPY